jgi:hypothetical protein
MRIGIVTTRLGRTYNNCNGQIHVKKFVLSSADIVTTGLGNTYNNYKK